VYRFRFNTYTVEQNVIHLAIDINEILEMNIGYFLSVVKIKLVYRKTVLKVSMKVQHDGPAKMQMQGLNNL
jgi:hypothetical protein